MNLTNRRPKPALFWSGVLLVGVSIWLALLVSPERAPYWVQKMWSVGYTRILGASSSELAHGSVSAKIWRGREIWPRTDESRSRLEFKKTATREEAANADSRVDGRARYRVFWLVVGFIGFLMMILGLGTSPTSPDSKSSLKTDKSPSDAGAIQPPAPSLNPDSTQAPIPAVPSAFAYKAPALTDEDRQAATEEAPTTVSPAETPKEVSSTEQSADSRELRVTWNETVKGQSSSYELVAQGDKLNEVVAATVFLDLKDYRLNSAQLRLDTVPRPGSKQ